MEHLKFAYCTVLDDDPQVTVQMESAPPTPPEPQPPPRPVSPSPVQPQGQEHSRQTRLTKREIVLITAVVIFAILSLIFCVLFFTTECNCATKKCNETATFTHPQHLPNITNNTPNNTISPTTTREPDLKPALRFKGRSTQDYVISTGAPAMNAITVCLWIKTIKSGDTETYVSYAVERNDNELVIENYEDSLTTWFFQTGGERPHKKTSPGIKINDGKWHHICVTWKSQGGAYQIYKDGVIAGHGSIAATAGKTIKDGGTWVLGQDQDEVGGGFQCSQQMKGEMAYCNVWSSVVSSTEILEMSESCKGFIKGNVKTWDDFLLGIKGKVETINATCI